MEKDCGTLRGLGIDARVSEWNPSAEGQEGRTEEDEDTSLSTRDAIEIAGGPIQQIDYSFLGEGAVLRSVEVPDARIGSEFPDISLESVRVKSFPLFGSVKEVRWKESSLSYGDEDESLFNLPVAEALSQDMDVRSAMMMAGIDLSFFADSDTGSWTLYPHPVKQWTRPTWDCCQAIAQSLLAMPMPTGE